jgi:hypothetical protein
MKRSHHFVSLIAIVCSFAISSISLAGSHEDKKPAKPAEPKITRSQAQLKVLFKYPGASVEKVELIQGKGHPNWLVDVLQSGARNYIQVQVDGVTGQILP